MHIRILGAAVALTLMAGPVTAADIAPAVVFDMGGKFDKSFNEGVYNGVEKFKSETGIDYREFEVTNETQREQALSRMAQRGADPVLGVGFAQAPAMEKVAKAHPDTKFAIIDSVVDLPNVRSIVFKEQEGSFLVGVLAAMASETGKIGFVGGMDIPLIRRFACGYVQGAKHANPDVEVFQNMTGTTPAAWNDPTKGGELARSQFDRGADVVFAAAGGTGIGVYQAAADSGKLAIGVDSNQNHLHPGTMLTSMLKRVDVAAYKAFTDAAGDSFTTGVEVLGLAEGGVDWALDEHNESLITDAMKAAVEKAKADIVAGTVTVHDYMADNSCPH
jgi:basic membrane protein A